MLAIRIGWGFSDGKVRGDVLGEALQVGMWEQDLGVAWEGEAIWNKVQERERLSLYIWHVRLQGMAGEDRGEESHRSLNACLPLTCSLPP